MHSSRVRLSKLECLLILTEVHFVLTTFKTNVSPTWLAEYILRAFSSVGFRKALGRANQTLLPALLLCSNEVYDVPCDYRVAPYRVAVWRSKEAMSLKCH